jgi:hypothetical protein
MNVISSSRGELELKFVPIAGIKMRKLISKSTKEL